MTEYFRLKSEELLLQLNQVKTFIKNHNPTIGILTEEILRNFLKGYLPKSISVEQGFVLNKESELSKQCDIIIYDSDLFAPFYRVNDIVVVPSQAVISIIEVKTTVTKSIFHSVIDYFKKISDVLEIGTGKHLFIYNSPRIENLEEYFFNYKHPGTYQKFDHDTFYELPDTITGIGDSYHLRKDYIVLDRDSKGYSSYNYKNEDNIDVSSLQLFFTKVNKEVQNYLSCKLNNEFVKPDIEEYQEGQNLYSFRAIELFDT